MTRLVRPLLLVVVGLALLAGSPLVWWLSQPEPTVGEVEPVATSDPVTLRRAPTTVPGTDMPEEPRTDRTTQQSAPTATGARPRRVAVPRIGVDHPVIPVGLEEDGAMEIPADVDEIGWYTGTQVRPGDHGSAVLAGHVDSRSQGRGAFFDVDHLAVGDDIHLDTDDGEQHWRVTGRTNYDKTHLPVDDIFTVDGDPRLVLITCGGPFDSDTRHYTQNTVVYAELVDGA